MAYQAYLRKYRHTKWNIAPFKTGIKSVIMTKINKNLKFYPKGLILGNNKLRKKTKDLNYLGELNFSMKIYTSTLEFRGCKCIRTCIASHIVTNFWRLTLNIFSWLLTPESPDSIKGILFWYTLESKSYLYILRFQIKFIWVLTTL